MLVLSTKWHIAQLYTVEKRAKEENLTEEQLLALRRECSKPVYDEIFSFLKEQRRVQVMLPKSPYSKAIGYALDNEKQLGVFLDIPEVPLDTNHIERENKKIAIGRKNFLVWSTEIGAHYLAIFYSLLNSIRLMGLCPAEYLTDVLQRIHTIPTEDLHKLTPRGWRKERLEAVPDSS